MDDAAAVVGYGLSFGSTLAIVMSYDVNHSLLWAILHGMLSWGYVGYRVVMHIFFNGI